MPFHAGEALPEAIESVFFDSECLQLLSEPSHISYRFYSFLKPEELDGPGSQGHEAVHIHEVAERGTVEVTDIG